MHNVITADYSSEKKQQVKHFHWSYSPINVPSVCNLNKSSHCHKLKQKPASDYRQGDTCWITLLLHTSYSPTKIWDKCNLSHKM